MVIIPLSKGKSAVIDDSDAELVRNYKWWASKGCKTWYAYAHIKTGYSGMHLRVGKRRKYKSISLHRLIMDCPKGMEVDHVDGDGLNCTRHNLRIATHGQNSQNTRLRHNNSTGFRGVTFSVRNGRKQYRAQIGVNKKFMHLGCFDNPVDAARAYNEASLKHHGEYGYRNLIP